MYTGIYFRTDGNSRIGYGHISRCIALAQIFETEFPCTFLLRETDAYWINKIQEKWQLLIMPDNVPFEQEALHFDKTLKNKNILILDGYAFDSDYQKRLKDNFECFLVSITDSNSMYFFSDLVINHSDFPEKNEYRTEPYTSLLIGPEYAILRRPFLQAAKVYDNNRNTFIQSVFICFGGADPFNLTEKTVLACLDSKRIRKIIVIIPEDLKKESQLKQAILKRDKKGIQVILEKNLEADQMAGRMKECQLAIVPSSTLSYEVCSVSTGLAAGFYVDNQLGIYQTLVHKGCCFPLEDLTNISRQELTKIVDNIEVERIIENQKKVFNGASGARILNEIKVKCLYKY